MVAAGGISSGINLGASFANHKSGARTSLSVVVSAVGILLAVLFLAPVIALVPRVVIAGLLLVGVAAVRPVEHPDRAADARQGFELEEHDLDLLVIAFRRRPRSPSTHHRRRDRPRRHPVLLFG
jgi:hypothetical protein